MSTSKNLTNQQVEQIAKLANLPLTREEVQNILPELSSTIKSIEILDELDVKGVIPTSHSLKTTNAYRNDEIKPSLTQDEATNNSKEIVNGVFIVPAVLVKN